MKNNCYARLEVIRSVLNGDQHTTVALFSAGDTGAAVPVARRCPRDPSRDGAKRGRKLGYRSSTTAPSWAVCGVCGAEAGRHSYYGAYTCKSCRAFFRR